jgi:hypothetical protein
METIRISWKKFVSSLERDVTRPQPQAYKILKKLFTSVTENVSINNIPHGTWLNYFQNFLVSGR